MPDPVVQTPPAAVPPQAPAPAKTPVPPVQAAPAKPVVPPTPAAPTPPAKPSGDTPPPAQEGTQVPITALHEEREKRQQLQAQLEAMKKVMSNNVLFDMNGNPVMQQQPQQQPQQQAYQQELEKLWESDPRKAVQAEIYAAMSWRDRVDADVESQASEVSGKYPDFNPLRPEIMNYIRTMPLEQRNRPGIIEAAYYFIRGQKVDNIIAQKQQELEAEYLRKFQAGELAAMLPPGSVSTPPSPSGAVTLTQDQKNAAAAMRIPEADYAKWIQNK